MTPPIDIRPVDLRIVWEVLRQHLPAGVRVWVFGSRASWMTKDSSDLDLALDGKTAIPLSRLSALEAAFEDSDLPYAVDIVDLKRVSDRFRRLVQLQRIPFPAAEESQDRGKWKDVPLDNLADIYDGPPATPGKTRRCPVILGISNLASVRLDLTQAEHLPEADYGRWMRRVMPAPNDIVFSYETRRGRRMGLIRPRDGEIDARYLLYAFLGDGVQNRLRAPAVHGNTVDRILPTEVSGVPVRVPQAITEQRAIAQILGRLDDKIDLNCRMNETLGAMVDSLFRSWFVEFDPVRAKMVSRDPGLAREFAEMFPDRLVDSDLGEIPEGWVVGTLGDMADASRRGGDPGQAAGDTPSVGLEPIPCRSIARTDWGQVGRVSSTGTVFENRASPLGKLRPSFPRAGIGPVNGVCPADIVMLKARKPAWSAFVLACVSSSGFVSYANQTSTGMQMPRTSWRMMSRYEMCRPSEPVLAAFQQIVSSMVEGIVANVHESRTLGLLRDTLLPRLVSGQLRVTGLDGSSMHEDRPPPPAAIPGACRSVDRG